MTSDRPFLHQATSGSMMNTGEAANALRLGIATLHRWRKEGKGPAYIEMGRKIYYRRAALEHWLDEQSRKPQPQRPELA